MYITFYHFIITLVLGQVNLQAFSKINEASGAYIIKCLCTINTIPDCTEEIFLSSRHYRQAIECNLFKTLNNVPNDIGRFRRTQCLAENTPWASIDNQSIQYAEFIGNLDCAGTSLERHRVVANGRCIFFLGWGFQNLKDSLKTTCDKGPSTF
jgi:hypothetical protein